MLGLRFLVLAAVVVALKAQSTREIVVHASQDIGMLKNLQGTNSADTSYTPPGTDTIYNKDPAIGELFPTYGIKHVLIYTFPDVFMGFGKTGVDGDPTVNDNYNWTRADDYMKYVVTNGAKATIQFAPTNATNSNVSSPEILGQIGFMIADRYMNGAYNSEFSDALELFDFLPESDVIRTSAEHYDEIFQYFAAFSRAVTKASPKVGVAAWGGNQIYPVRTNYSVYDPYVARFYKDCRDQDVPIKAASFHFTNSQFSFDPYDIIRVVEKFRTEVLIPAGLPDLAIWATEYDMAPYPALPTTTTALEDFNDPAFFASYTLGVSMYAQDTLIDQVMAWPGFGYNGTGGGNQPFHGFFNRSSSGPIPLNAAKAWLLQGKLVMETPHRLRVEGNSSDGFAVLAGYSADRQKVQVLLNNYQLNYAIPQEYTAQMLPLMNTSATAYPPLQDNGLMNGEATCLIFGACLTFPTPTVRDNLSQSYDLKLKDLPWDSQDRYRLEVHRVADSTARNVFFVEEGRGNVMGKSAAFLETAGKCYVPVRTYKSDLSLPFPANAQDLIVVTRLA